MLQPNTSRPKKLQRVSQACDLCHRRSIKCRPSAEKPLLQCQNCFDFAVECTYRRPSRRRRHVDIAETPPTDCARSQQPYANDGGRQSFPQDSQGRVLPQQLHAPVVDQNQQTINNAAIHVNHDISETNTNSWDGRPSGHVGAAWRSFALASGAAIDQYLELYLQVVYPIFPFFHENTLREKVKQGHHLRDRGFFASVLAACALAAARARDGAAGDAPLHFARDPEKSSELFFAAAQDALTYNLSKARGLDYLRACGLLALTSMQYGQIVTMHQFVGHYFTLSAMQKFHDERCWPAGITVVEKEERRRLFWSMYTLDIYSSVVFDSLMKSQETHSNVCYPTEVNDDDLNAGVLSPTGGCWLRGWNFTTDLYRVLEHLIKRLRRKTHIGENRPSIVQLVVVDVRLEPEIMESILGLYDQLPHRFKDYSVKMTGQRNQDIYSFQSANIQATLQLVRMTLFSADYVHDINQKCVVADQVLTTFHHIDPPFLSAISTPLVYHLGGIGQMLASATINPLGEASYQRVRTLLVSMADLLARLEHGLQLTVGASDDLRAQIQRIDEYIETQREMIVPASQQQQQRRLGSEDPTVRGSMDNETSQALARGTMSGEQTLTDEFQLPHDLTHAGAWPWPFFVQEQELPGLTDFG